MRCLLVIASHANRGRDARQFEPSPRVSHHPAAGYALAPSDSTQGDPIEVAVGFIAVVTAGLMWALTGAMVSTASRRGRDVVAMLGVAGLSAGGRHVHRGLQRL
jgi:hypothetical protein